MASSVIFGVVARTRGVHLYSIASHRDIILSNVLTGHWYYSYIVSCSLLYRQVHESKLKCHHVTFSPSIFVFSLAAITVPQLELAKQGSVNTPSGIGWPSTDQNTFKPKGSIMTRITGVSIGICVCTLLREADPSTGTHVCFGLQMSALCSTLSNFKSYKLYMNLSSPLRTPAHYGHLLSPVFSFEKGSHPVRFWVS